MAESTHRSRGFFPQNLPSPAPSNVLTSPAPTNLPHPRSRPLLPGSAKEATTRRYVENRLLHISRRFAKKFQPPVEGEEAPGYTTFVDVCKDIGGVIDILWLSGTPSLQIPQLLSIAGALMDYMTGLPPASNATFTLFKKLDHVFVSLLRGQDSITGEALPGIENDKRVLSRTDMVRLRSLVEETRILVVDVMSKVTDHVDDVTEDSESETDDMELDSEVDDEEDTGLEMEIARVYAETIVQLGLLLPSDSAFGATNGQR